MHTPEQRLRFYAKQFDFVEVNSTHYALPDPATTKAWADRTPEGFVFNIKAFSLLTHHQTKTAMLPPDLRQTDRGSVGQRHLARTHVDALWDRFLNTVAPVHEAGKLGLLLFQFPPWFRPGDSAREYLLECRRRTAPLRICVEFRAAGWVPDELDFLAAHDITYVCVDMPRPIPPVLAVTSDDAVVRFHGHSQLWDTGTKEEKYRYRYSEGELDEWAAKIRDLAEQARTTYVVMNNCFADDAQVNAAYLRGAL
ncbi:DUF72 domain-containing protein [Kibdelosporangium persicum]|uniref:DUF72 domain-containing protein n=1 Tax=Kibdelosporangium persicum TaxID=2698649 RepID=UPI0028AB0C47|nr:DUF72 domain-containing protein [Kibdelosporangium persicum]